MTAAVAVLVMAGCTLSVDANRKQCKVDGDCKDRGLAFENTVCSGGLCSPPPPPPDWLCLNDPVPPAAPADARFIVRSRAQQIAPAEPVEGVTVKVCAKLDTQCSAPMNAGNIPTTQANGDFEVEVAANFTGYLKLEKEEWMTVYYFFYPTVRQDVTNVATIQMVKSALAPFLVRLLEVPVVPDRGIILLSAWNCEGRAAADVLFESANGDSATKGFYVVGTLPEKTAAETDSSGYGGFVNMPGIGEDSDIPGTSVKVTGRLKETREEIATLSLISYPNSLTISRMVHLGDP